GRPYPRDGDGARRSGGGGRAGGTRRQSPVRARAPRPRERAAAARRLLGPRAAGGRLAGATRHGGRGGMVGGRAPPTGVVARVADAVGVRASPGRGRRVRAASARVVVAGLVTLVALTGACTKMKPATSGGGNAGGEASYFYDNRDRLKDAPPDLAGALQVSLGTFSQPAGRKV